MKGETDINRLYICKFVKVIVNPLLIRFNIALFAGKDIDRAIEHKNTSDMISLATLNRGKGSYITISAYNRP
jgi:hypothetical protein